MTNKQIADKLANEIWRALPFDCKFIMRGLKESFIITISNDIEKELDDAYEKGIENKKC